MVKPFIALYKAWRGGEFFRASLESVRAYTNGAVVVFSDAPWLHGLSLPENCSKPLAEYQAISPARNDEAAGWPIVECHGTWRRQEDQYDVGLAAIRERWGDHAAVLVIDTEEVWEPEMIKRLREAVMSNPGFHYFNSRIWSYLRSPLYVTWPVETPHVLVALQNATQPCVKGRFQDGKGTMLELPNVDFHHFTYVRDDPADIQEKFLNTSSQEDVTSNTAWLDNVWPNLPLGKKLHMTPGCEGVWGEIKILTPRFLPESVLGLPFVGRLTAEEDARWRDRLRETPVAEQLLPLPTWDKRLYENDLQRYLDDDLTKLVSRMQTSYLEQLVLAQWASEVPAGGRIAELGCGHGCTTTMLAAASPGGVMVDAIDPFEPYDEIAAGGLVKDVMEGNEVDFWDTLLHYGLAGRVRHLNHLSSKVAPFLYGDGYDLVLVDANHSHKWAAHDLDLMWSFVKPGGLLVTHDYTTRFPGVIQAVDEHPAEFRVAAGTSLAYARMPLCIFELLEADQSQTRESTQSYAEYKREVLAGKDAP